MSLLIGAAGFITGAVAAVFFFRAIAKKRKPRRRKTKTENTPAKREFSKLHVVFADGLVAFVFVANVILSAFDKMPLSDLSVAIVTIYGGFATGGYFTLCAVRDTSLNKHHLRIVTDENGAPATEAIFEGLGGTTPDPANVT